MMKKFNLVLGIVVLILLIAGISEAQVTRHLQLSSAAFRPTNEEIDYYSSFLYSWADNTSPVGGALFLAPVHLPDGAKYKKIYLRCMDLDLNHDITVGLIRVSINDETDYDIIYLANTTAAAGWQVITDTSINYSGSRLVNNEKWSYIAYVLIGNIAADSDLRWQNFKIRYEY